MPFSIPAAPSQPALSVHYKAFSDSWVVLVPGGQGLYATDLLIPQLCWANATCPTLDMAALVGNCSMLSSVLHETGWHNARLDAFMRDSDLCHTLAEANFGQHQVELQLKLQDVCREPCAHVLQPLGLEIMGSAEAALAPFDRDPSFKTLLQARIVAVTVMSGSNEHPSTAQSTNTMLAISTHVFHVRLQREGLASISMNLQHECARRGLRAPPLSTMDLFLDDGGALVCNWNCRPDHVRAQWNLAPLSVNMSAAELAQSRHVCWPFPERFVAVFFSLHVGTTVRRPHATLLPPAFYDGVNALADDMQQERFGGGMVLLNVPSSSFDNVKFRRIVRDAVRFRGMEGQYEVLDLGTLNAAYNVRVSGDSPTRRRLLELGAAQGVLTVEGVAINPEAALKPARYIAEVNDAVAAARTRLPSALTDVGSVDVKELHRVAPTTATPPTADDSASSHARRSAAIGLEVVFFLAAGIVTCFYMASSKRRRRGGGE